MLPLQNTNGDVSLDFLRFALADEVANALTSTRTLDVRPSLMTRKYVGADVDPRTAASELRVGTIVTGHFMQQGDKLMVTLEAVEGSSDKVLWQTSVTVPANDLIGLQSVLNKQVTQGLLPAIGMAGAQSEAGTHPHDPAAYDLYLHSLALSHDPGAEQRRHRCTGARRYRRSQLCSRMGGTGPSRVLRFAVLRRRGRDVPALYAGFRAGRGAGSQSSGGGRARSSRTGWSAASWARPTSPPQELVKRLPENAQAHFVMSYVYRYAGMLEPAMQECNKALALDPGNYTFRSCAWAFMEAGDTKRAADFIKLDAGSQWAAYATPSLLLREGKIDEARVAVSKMPTQPRYHRDLLEACLRLRPYSDAQEMAHAGGDHHSRCSRR